MTYKSQFYGEICCEECLEIVHNYFDCPICKHGCEATDIYCDLSQSDSIYFSCKRCDTKFRFLSKPEYGIEVEFK